MSRPDAERTLRTVSDTSMVSRSDERNPPVGFIRPCEPTLVDQPPAGDGWLHEIKHDGFRVLARKQGGQVKIWSRRGANFTDRFPGDRRGRA